MDERSFGQKESNILLTRWITLTENEYYSAQNLFKFS